jgi:hypothetical protein
MLRIIDGKLTQKQGIKTAVVFVKENGQSDDQINL